MAHEATNKKIEDTPSITMNKWNSNFILGDSISKEQLEFFDKNGCILFRNFINLERVSLFLTEIERLTNYLLENNIQKVFGIPLKFGEDELGKIMVQRFCFASLHSEVFHNFLQEPAFKTLLQLMHNASGRISEEEKDGLVINQYINKPKSNFTQMGWHTDSPRDLFLGHRIMPMLNIGIHLDDCPLEHGGLRILPGTHKQHITKLLLRKKYFIDNNDDPNEVGFDIKAGDLTIHDGRLWHRVKQSPLMGAASIRRVMYIPIIAGKYLPKNDKSKTPLYHKLATITKS